MKVAVIGTGYVGLVVGACLAETGCDVICVDIDEARISQLQNGEIPIYEPGLEPLVRRNREDGRLTFSADTVKAVETGSIVFLAVPTPSDEDGSADLRHILDAAREVAKGINDYKVIVDKSTVPVGTARKVHSVIAELTDRPFDVVSNPEFLKEGSAVDDFMKPDRIIIGCDSERAAKLIRDIYSPFYRTGKPILEMKVESAELTKYAANALLATRISFMNEIARLCEKVGADVHEVRLGVGSDSRIGKQFLFAGIGFGGSCFPKDLRALKHMGRQNELELKMIDATIDANEIQKKFLPRKILHRFGTDLSGITFALWGLSFKANTDDIRESPALVILDELLEKGAMFKVYDPVAMPNTKRIYGDRIIFTPINYDALIGADALIVATEWHEFRRPDFDKVRSMMKQAIIFDGRNLFDPQQMKSIGFEYHGVGQG